MFDIYLYPFIGTLLCFLFSLIGASFVFFPFFKKSHSLQNFLMSFSAGIMVAVTCWSLILPSLNYFVELYKNVLYTSISIVIGVLIFLLIDFLIQKKESTFNEHFIFLSLTFHNIPEGMSVAILIANIQILQPMNIFLACSLALGVAIQNIPESSTISFYYNQKGKNKFVSFLFSAISGIVEPIFGLVAILLFSIFSNILPILLSLSAGTMLYVTLKELLPECYENYGKSKTSFAFCLGFVFMTILDNAL